MLPGANLGRPEIVIDSEAARFLLLEAWMHTEIKGWARAGMIDEAQFQLLLCEAEGVLRPFVAADGRVAFDTPAHIVTTDRVQRTRTGANERQPGDNTNY
jgi:hypothetical protein